MAAGGSTRVVLAALGCNALIALSKFAAATYTGSSAMLSEAIHSLVDTLNQALLLHGIRRSRRPPDAHHPFGYSRELYFWSFIVAILLFSMGAGVSVYEGIVKLVEPHPISNPEVNYIVLGVALALESVSTFVAVGEFNAVRGTTGALDAIRASKDPGLFTVLLEDIAALAGLVTALIGISIAHLAGIEAADGIASIVIGLILGCVAAFLSIEIKALLIGEAASAELQAGLAQRIGAEVGPAARIRAVNEIRTMQLGPGDVLVAASVDMDDHASAADVEAVTGRLDRVIRNDFPQVRHLFLEVQSAAHHRTAAGGGAAPPVPQSQSESHADATGPALPRPAGLALVTRPPHAKKGRGKRRR